MDVDILSNFFLLVMIPFSSFFFLWINIDFQMLDQPCIPEISPKGYAVLSFLYIASFYLLIFCYRFCISFNEGYWFVTSFLSPFFPHSPLSSFSSNVFSDIFLRYLIESTSNHLGLEFPFQKGFDNKFNLFTS